MYRKAVIAMIVLAFILMSALSMSAQNQSNVLVCVLVGPKNDGGWSQAHAEACELVAEKYGLELTIIESLNPADSPDLTLEDVVASTYEPGALYITTSDAFEEDTDAVARMYPDAFFVNASGDDVVAVEDVPSNLSNVMGQMIWPKFIAGCAAALATETGHIAYLGPLENHETWGLARSAYLGAEYCWVNVLGRDIDDLEWSEVFIGFWFYIPGFTLDPTEVANAFFDADVDVVICGIDTPECLTVAAQRAEDGEQVWAIPYDYVGACDQAPEVCLGVPFFNWYPAYNDIVIDWLDDGVVEQSWVWKAPYWPDLTDMDQTSVGWIMGDGLTDEQVEQLDEFITWLADHDLGDIDQDSFFDENLVFVIWDRTADKIWYYDPSDE